MPGVLIALPLIAGLVGCGGGDGNFGTDELRIETERLSSIVRELASDAYEVRAQDIELYRMIIEDLGKSQCWPQWKTGSEFKAIREQSADARR